MARPRTSGRKQPSKAEPQPPRSAEQFCYGQVLRFACLAKEIAPRDFSTAINVGLKSVRKWFEGQTKPRKENRAKAFTFLRLNDERFQELARRLQATKALLEQEPYEATTRSGAHYPYNLIAPSSEIAEGPEIAQQVEAWVRSLIRKELAADRQGDPPHS